MFFEKNRNLLAKRYPFLLNELSGLGSREITLEVERSKTGLPVARVNRAGRKVYLNSPYDPELDARRWAESQIPEPEETASSTVLICGGGFLYHIKALLDRKSDQKFVVYEPSLAVFEACLREIDLEPLCGPNILLLAGEDFDKLFKLIVAFLDKDLFQSKTGLRIVILPSYQDIFREELDLFQNKFAEFINVEHFNLATTDKYRENWLINQFNNLRSIPDTPAIRHFMGQFRGVPAVIVSAGPSLEKNIALLKEFKEKVLIICAGSSIRAMKKKGISPHFLVAVDPHEINARVYNDLDLTDSYFLYCLSFYHGVVSRLPGRKIVFQTNAENFPNFIAQKFNYEFGMLNCGFSCAHTCLDLAYRLGCNPIILIGQDLAYTGNKRYAEGQIDYSQKYIEENELLPKGFFISKDIYGRDTVTDKQLDSFRIIFETMIDGLYRDKALIINATEGGLPIKGTVNRKLAEVLTEYCYEDRGIGGLIRSLYERGLKELRDCRPDPGLLAIKLKALMEQGIDKMEELIDRIQQLRKLNFFGDTDFKTLDAILERIAGEYDTALNYQEYHALLKELQVTKLSISKFRTVETAKIKSKDEYDERLRNYLLIVVETKNALDYIRKTITETFAAEETGPIAPKAAIIGTAEYQSLQKRVHRNDNPNEIRRLLELNLKRAHTPDERGAYLYLYGLFQFRQGRKESATALLEETVTLNDSSVEALFLFAKLYYEQRKFTRAVRYLTKCREHGFKPEYCLKLLLKINYLCKDYVVVKNLAEDYPAAKTSRRLLGAIKIECLARLGLAVEAVKTYRALVGRYRLSYRLSAWLDNLINSRTENEYGLVYRSNLEFFKKRGMDFKDFEGIRYQACRFLGGEIVYDTASGKFLPGFGQTPADDLKIWLEDILVIHDSESTGVFNRLLGIGQEIGSPDIRNQFQDIPVFVIDHDWEHWRFMMQLFDFRLFDAWRNMRFYIGLTDTELQAAFEDESALFPTVLHGKNPEQFERLLSKAKETRDEVYHKRMAELKEYYRDTKESRLARVLFIYNFKNETARFYAEVFKSYLMAKGIECRMYCEDPPYNKFTRHANARILEEYKPNLILGLGLVQEEIEALNEIPAPFVSWLPAEKNLDGVSRADCPAQRVFVTGNLKVKSEMAVKGYPADRIREIALPVVARMDGKNADLPNVINDIGLISDLLNLDQTLSNLQVVVYRLMSLSNRVYEADIAAMLKTAYFKIHKEYMEIGLNRLENESYRIIVTESFSKYGLPLKQDVVQFVAALLKKELENYFFTTMQARWLTDNRKDYRIAFYGTGWGEIGYFKPYHQETAGFFVDPAGYRQLALRNKINIYTGNILQNNSYMQPDLINGFAAGGFFLVNDLPVKDFGPQVLEPFGGLLETYGNQEELREKCAYYLEHEAKRLARAKQLQEYVQKHFDGEKIFSFLIRDY